MACPMNSPGALTAFGEGVERIIGSSRSLRLLPPQQRLEDGSIDEELAQRTIFPLVISHRDRVLALDDCRKIYARCPGCSDRATADMHQRDAEIAARVCLIGQPVALAQRGPHRSRRCVSVRARVSSPRPGHLMRTQRTGICSANSAASAHRRQDEWLLAQMDGLNQAEASHGA